MSAIDREAMIARANEFVRGVEALSGLQLSFAVESLGDLDGWLAEWIDMASVYDSPHAVSVESLVDPISSYVGEVLVRSLGAAWEIPQSGDASSPHLRLKSGQRLDLHEAVAAVLRRAASPAFRKLALLAAALPSEPGEEANASPVPRRAV